MANYNSCNIAKQKEVLELRKLYLIQFEKFETKVFLSWMSIFLALFVSWIYGRINGCLILVLALFTILLDYIIESWRKNKFNSLIGEIKSGDIGEIE